MRWNVAQIAEQVAGRLIGSGDVDAVSISTDTRTLTPGAVFFALRGENFDGHDHAPAAIERGAVAVVVERVVDAGSQIVVADTQRALLDLATAKRNALTVPVIAVTGSTGKTSTKDLLVVALPGAHGSPRSFNNEVGVPLTILTAPDDIDHLVMEVGSRGAGHIAALMPAVQPNVSIITNLGVVHMETFGTPEGLAAAKWELVEGTGSDGTAVLPASEDRLLPPVRTHPGRTITFGAGAGDVAVHDLELDSEGRPRFRLVTPIGDAEIALPVMGAHQALNAAAAVAAGVAVDVPLDVMMEGLETATTSPWRMERHDGRYTVINDAYNANPDSMAAAFRLVGSLPGRHVAVLGKMAELGHLSASEHRRIGRLAHDLGFEKIVVVGEDPGIAAGAGDRAVAVDDAAAAKDVVREFVHDGDVVLVKASRSVGLEGLAAELAAEASR